MKKKHPVFWTAGKIRRRIPALLVLTGSQIGFSLFSVAFALGSRGIIDSAVTGNAAAFRRACLVQLGIIGGILTCLAVGRHLRERLKADLDRDWKGQLLHGLLHGDYAAVSQYHSAELLNRMNNDAAKVSEGITGILPGAAAMVTRLVAAVGVLGALDGRFALMVVPAGAVVIGATGLMRRRLKALNKEVSRQDGLVSGFLQEAMEKLLMVQAMDVSQEMERRAEGLMEDRWAVQRRRKNVSLVTNTGVSLLGYGAGFAALCWCAYRMLLGEMSFGSLTAVTQLVGQLQAPFVNLSGVMPLYTAMTAAAERLMELDAIAGEPEPEGDAGALYREMTAIRGEGLCFSYGRERVLEGVSFAVPKGAFAAVTGPSGTGKSTLLKLLLGIYRPDGGTLALECGGKKIPLDRSTRRLFAYVPQGNLLLSGTIRENLTITKPEATEAEIRQAVWSGGLEEVIAQLPMGLDTVLSEDGGGLSEGQGQRLAIARAVLGGAPVLLLDECTSALDEETERTVLQRLKGLPGRTCIAVTHRAAAVDIADVQLKMES